MPKANGAARHIPWQNHVFTAAQLRLRTFPSISYVVPDLLPDGLSIIAGRPKIRKSWLALDVCIAAASGRFAAAAPHRQGAFPIQNTMARAADPRHLMAAPRPTPLQLEPPKCESNRLMREADTAIGPRERKPRKR